MLLFVNYNYSQDAEVEVEIMTVEEMMNMLVVTASKEEQKISDAPAIIDVITKQQIQDFNANNLYELLSYLPGIETMETYFGRTVLNFRGIQNTHYTNKILLMVNGIPFFEPVYGTFYLENIPISSVSKIEVIRGPGSSLYGTNAYAGVINIITEANKDKNEVELAATYGSFSTKEFEASANFKIKDKGSVFLAGSFANSDGYDFNVTADETGTAKTFKYLNEPISIYGNLTYDKFFLEAGYFKTEKTLYGLTPNLNYSGLSNPRNFFAHSKYNFDLSENVSSSILVRFATFEDPETSIGFFPFRGFPGHDESEVFLEYAGSVFSTELQLNSKLSDEVTNVTGVAFETLKTDPYLWKWETDGALNPFTAYQDEHSSNNIAGYSQFNYKASEKVNFVGGVRLVKDKDVDDLFFSPRAGLIYKASKNYSLKALYGKAFRSPTFFEKYVSTTNVLFGSTSLEPEIIQTLDFGLEMAIEDVMNARVNGFYQTTSDGIVRQPTSNPDEHGSRAAEYVNSSEIKVYGIELSANGGFAKTGYFGFNFSWKKGDIIVEDGDDVELLGNAPITANGWLTYKWGKFSLTPHLQFVGEREGTSTRDIDPDPDVTRAFGDYTVDSYLLANLTFAYKIQNFTIKLTGRNLFDSDYAYPEYIRGRSEEVPGGPERSFFVTLKYSITSSD